MKDKFGLITDPIKYKKLFLFDMDGTIYEESTLYQGTLDLLKEINRREGKYVFITNNSSKSVKDYVEKLTNMGIEAGEENFFTSSQATILYLKENHPDAKVYCVGTESFLKELKDGGITLVEADMAELLLVGFDTELNYSKLWDASRLLQTTDIPYIATNPDLVCPTGFGFVPDCGSICEMLKTATGKEPIYIGKPKATMVNLAMEATGFSSKETVVVGDRLYTDIACGVNAGVSTVCVLTGEATIPEINSSDIKPEYTLDCIQKLYEAYTEK